MTITRLFLIASALLIAACTDDAEDPNKGKISVVDWATEMARSPEPHTIQDKFAIVYDTDDRAAFEGVIEIAKEQAAAEAAAEAAEPPSGE
jgi:hypothetical protein